MTKLDRGYDDLVEERISQEFWTRRSREWEAELQVLDGERARVQQPRPPVAVTARKTLGLARTGRKSLQIAESAEQRRLLETGDRL
jgi:hypothetical protein